MKVMQRGVMKILPGKMAEAMELLKEWTAIVSRMGIDTKKMRGYRPVFGGEAMHTIIFEVEWDSFPAIAAFFDKAFADPKFQESMAKWGTVLDSHEVELYMVMP